MEAVKNNVVTNIHEHVMVRINYFDKLGNSIMVNGMPKMDVIRDSYVKDEYVYEYIDGEARRKYTVYVNGNKINETVKSVYRNGFLVDIDVITE